MSHDGHNVHNALAVKFKEKYQSGFSSAELSNEECETLLKTITLTYSRITLILDALDECEERSRLWLLNSFDRLVCVCSGLKIFISSRRNDDIKRRLRDKINFGIDATNNSNNIKVFVLSKLNEGEEERGQPFSDGLRNKIVQTLFEKSRGMCVFY